MRLASDESTLFYFAEVAAMCDFLFRRRVYRYSYLNFIYTGLLAYIYVIRVCKFP